MIAYFRKVLRYISSKDTYEKINFLIKNKYLLNLKSPESFNEILSYNKINYESVYGEGVCELISDKYRVREYVSSKIGSEYLCKIYDVYVKSSEFDYKKLPNSFVLKANHGSGEDFIKKINNKNSVDQSDIMLWIDNTLKKEYGVLTNELWYLDIDKKMVIAEEMLNPSGEDLKDYKFFIIRGQIILIQVDQNRFINHQKSLYDENWNYINVKFNYPIGEFVKPPSRYNEMKVIAKKLAENLEFCRVDLYQDENDRIKFGEITVSPASAWGPFKPRSFDYELGAKYKGLIEKR